MTFRDCQCDKPECPQCGPLVALAEQVRREYEQTARDARIPTPEIVWWRAQMKAREEAARTAARPIVFTQALAIAALIGLVVSVAGRLTLPALSFAGLGQLAVGVPVLHVTIAAICCLLIAPLAVYLALSRD